MAKYLQLQNIAVAIFVCGFGSFIFSEAKKEFTSPEVDAASCNCGTPRPTWIPTPSPTAPASPTPSPSSSPSSNPSPQPSPSVGPTPQPSPSPSLDPSPRPSPSTDPSPDPTTSPKPSSPKPSSRYTRLETTPMTCTQREYFDATMEIRYLDEDVEGVKVRFSYNGESREATTGSNGEATVRFAYATNSGVVADPEGLYKSESVEVWAPSDEECEGTGGSGGTGGPNGNGGASGTSTNSTDVLGASTMADTGVVGDALLNIFGNLGGILTVVGTALYAKQKKHQPHQ